MSNHEYEQRKRALLEAEAAEATIRTAKAAAVIAREQVRSAQITEAIAREQARASEAALEHQRKIENLKKVELQLLEDKAQFERDIAMLENEAAADKASYLVERIGHFFKRKHELTTEKIINQASKGLSQRLAEIKPFCESIANHQQTFLVKYANLNTRVAKLKESKVVIEKKLPRVSSSRYVKSGIICLAITAVSLLALQSLALSNELFGILIFVVVICVCCSGGAFVGAILTKVAHSWVMVSHGKEWKAVNEDLPELERQLHELSVKNDAFIESKKKEMEQHFRDDFVLISREIVSSAWFRSYEDFQEGTSKNHVFLR